jgi:hypothetical protein
MSETVVGEAGLTSCIVCGGQARLPVLALDQDVPVLCNVLLNSAEEARNAARGRIELASCSGCGHVWNVAFDESVIDYNQRYENSLHFSPTFQRFAEGVVQELVNDFEIRDGTVVEVGCGKGDFLAMICRAGQNRGVGYDPSYAGHQDPGAGRGLEIMPEAFPDLARPLSALALVTRHLLEHVVDPTALMRALVATTARGESPVHYHEVPNGQYLLESVALWDVIYEHPSHFTPQSMQQLFDLAGLTTERLSPAFGSQYISAIGRVRGETHPVPGPVTVDPSAARNFARRARDLLARVSEDLEHALDRGLSVALWGAGSKGVNFLTMVAPAAGVQHVIDVNPRKHGLYVPLTGHQVEGPESLAGGVDRVIVMNPLYVDEVTETMRRLGSACVVVPAGAAVDRP